MHTSIKYYCFKILIIVLCTTTNVSAQYNTTIKLQNEFYQNTFEKYCINNQVSYNFFNKPYTIVSYKKNIDSILANEFCLKKSGNNFFYKAFRKGDLVSITTNDKRITTTINPLFNLEVGQSNLQQKIFQINRGIRADINIQNKVFISSSFLESYSKFPNYISQYITKTTVVPGSGKARINGNKIEFATPIGYALFNVSSNYAVEIGNDRHFMGIGKRSLLLSDFSYPYPYIKQQFNLGKIYLTNIWAQFTDASKNWVNNNGYDKKYGAFNTIGFTGIKNTQINLFQSIIWTNRDDLGNLREQEWGYFIPIIFLNSFNFNNGSPDNSVIGLDVNYTLKKKHVVYAQAVIDDYNIGESRKGKGYFQNKYGVQVGVKTYDLLNVENLFARLEYNTVRPYTYGNKTPAINYSHYGEVLAHPLGANFKEFLLEFSYRKKRLLFETNLVIAKYGADTAQSHWGNNIFYSDYKSQLGIFSYNNSTLQGLATKLSVFKFKASYLMNPAINSQLSFMYLLRHHNNILQSQKETIFSVSFSTNLFNTSTLF